MDLVALFAGSLIPTFVFASSIRFSHNPFVHESNKSVQETRLTHLLSKAEMVQ